jgi:hypothetical protein
MNPASALVNMTGRRTYHHYGTFIRIALERFFGLTKSLMAIR